MYERTIVAIAVPIGCKEYSLQRKFLSRFKSIPTQHQTNCKHAYTHRQTEVAVAPKITPPALRWRVIWMRIAKFLSQRATLNLKTIYTIVQHPSRCSWYGAAERGAPKSLRKAKNNRTTAVTSAILFLLGMHMLTEKRSSRIFGVGCIQLNWLIWLRPRVAVVLSSICARYNRKQTHVD